MKDGKGAFLNAGSFGGSELSVESPAREFGNLNKAWISLRMI